MTKMWTCLLQYVVDGQVLWGLIMVWPGETAAEAAQAASRLELWPGAQRHRITVVPFEHSETFQWLGAGEVKSERR